MAQVQSTNLIRIDSAHLEAQGPTENGDDPVLLSELQGTEGFSQGFSYECTMLRNKENGEIGLEPMINTLARVGMRVNTPDGVKWMCRTGVIDYFQETSITTKFRTRFYYTYKARIIPPLEMMVQQRMFRIFENTTPKKILETVLASVPHIKAGGKTAYDLRNLDLPEFHYKDYYLDHRIQFGEDTHSFLTRLMAEFGIWYYYDYQWLTPNQVASTRKSLACSPILLFGVVRGRSDPRRFFSPIDYNPQPEAVNEAPGDNSVGGVNRSFNPVISYFEVGDFNQLKPSAPRLGTASVPNRGKEGPPAPDSDDQSWSRLFPASLNRQNDADYAAHALLGQSRQTNTMIVGSSANPAFAVGRTFEISKDEDNPDEEGRDFVISSMAFHTYDDSIGQNAGTTFFSFINGWVWEPIKGAATDLVYWTCTLFGAKPPDWAGSGNAGNISISLAAAGLTNMWQNKIQNDAQSAQNASLPVSNNLGAEKSTNLSAATYFEAGAVAQIVNVLVAQAPQIGKPLAEFWQAIGARDSGKYGNTFTAQSNWLDQPLLPKAPPISVAGPHLAVVIGEHGAIKGNGKDQGEDITGIYADDLGRVRIRFPWDPGPPVDNSKASPPAAVKTPPLAYGENTCWVRVSQPWASRGYGAQFLPRIGDEVIVDFIAGNPDRPIITGRVYNADHGTANQPFPKDRKADPRSVKIADDYLLNASPPTSGKFTRSGVKTATVKDDTGEVVDNNYHLLRFDDNSTYNQVLVRSQGRLDITAFDTRYESIHQDRHLTVGGKKTKQSGDGATATDSDQPIWGDYKAHVFRHYHLHVGDSEYPTQSGNRLTLLEQNEELQVKGDLGQLVGGNWSVSVGNPGPSMSAQATIDAGGPLGTIVLNANFNITLSVGANAIVITPAGISITSPFLINLVTPALFSTTPLVPIGAVSFPPAPPIDPNVSPPDKPADADDGSTTLPPGK